jgi:hypothetical protein
MTMSTARAAAVGSIVGLLAAVPASAQVQHQETNLRLVSLTPHARSTLDSAGVVVARFSYHIFGFSPQRFSYRIQASLVQSTQRSARDIEPENAPELLAPGGEVVVRTPLAGVWHADWVKPPYHLFYSLVGYPRASPQSKLILRMIGPVSFATTMAPLTGRATARELLFDSTLVAEEPMQPIGKPPEVKTNEKCANATLGFFVGPDGIVEPESIHVLSSFPPGFGDAAAKAVQKERFTIPRSQGVPTRRWAQQTVRKNELGSGMVGCVEIGSGPWDRQVLRLEHELLTYLLVEVLHPELEPRYEHICVDLTPGMNLPPPSGLLERIEIYHPLLHPSTDCLRSANGEHSVAGMKAAGLYLGDRPLAPVEEAEIRVLIEEPGRSQSVQVCHLKVSGGSWKVLKCER